MFCAAIPVTLAVGVAAQAQQSRQSRSTQSQRTPSAAPSSPIGAATLTVTAGLIVCSVIYHTHLGG